MSAPLPPPPPLVPPPIPRARAAAPQPTGEESAPDSRTPLPKGSQVGDYIITDLLGRGGFGITYRARHSINGARVVVKEHIPEGLATREKDGTTVTYTAPEHEELFRATLAEFTEEVNVLMGLQHPGIVPILNAFEANGTAYYVMPFVAGSPLELSPHNSLNPERQAQEARRIKRLLLLLLDTLSYLEQHNVVHRDIKPENIRITPEGQPVLLDFGSARQLQPGKVYRNIYTPGFCSPEQATAATDSAMTQRLGPWTDIYSLGATFLYLITRMLPPRADMRAAASPDPYKPLAGRSRPEALYGRSFLHALDRALELKPRDRWQDAGAWRAAIEEGVLPVSPRRLRRTRLLAIGSALALTVFGAVSLWALHERDQARRVYGSSLRFTESILYDFNEELADIPGSIGLQQQLGTRLKRYLDEMETMPQDRDDDKLPHAMATAWINLGSVYVEQGKLPEATAALTKATELERQLVRDNPEDQRACYELARTLTMRAEVARRRNLIPNARALSAEAVALLRELSHEHADNPDFRCGLARALGMMARVAQPEGDTECRKQALDEMLALCRELTVAYPEHIPAQTELADCLHLRGGMATEQGDYANAAHLYEEAHRIYARLSAAQPYRLSYKRGLATALYDNGRLFIELSQSSEETENGREYDLKALEALGKHLELVHELEALDPNNADFPTMECRAIAFMVEALLRTEQPARAIAMCNTLMQKSDALLAASPDDIDINLIKLGAWRSLAIAHNGSDETRGLAAEELTQYRRWADKLRRRSPANIALQFTYLDALSLSATVALQTGDVFNALSWLHEAETQLSELVRSHPDNEALTKRLERFRRRLQELPAAK